MPCLLLSSSTDYIGTRAHFKNKLRDSWIRFDQTFQGLGLGTLFPARESLVSEIPAGEGKSLNLYLQCKQTTFLCCRGFGSIPLPLQDLLGKNLYATQTGKG